MGKELTLYPRVAILNSATMKSYQLTQSNSIQNCDGLTIDISDGEFTAQVYQIESRKIFVDRPLDVT